MGDPRLPKERVFTPADFAKAAKEGKVYSPKLVDFVPFEPDADLRKLLIGAGWKPPSERA